MQSQVPSTNKVLESSTDIYQFMDISQSINISHQLRVSQSMDIPHLQMPITPSSLDVHTET